MSSCVLDASAVLAVLRSEPGAEKVLERLSGAVISAVNFAEVLTALSRVNRFDDQLLTDLRNMLPDIRPFNAAQAHLVGQLEPGTRPSGLSLGDRACLALARQLSLPALTADQVWKRLELGVTVELIRPLTP